MEFVVTVFTSSQVIKKLVGENIVRLCVVVKHNLTVKMSAVIFVASKYTDRLHDRKTRLVECFFAASRVRHVGEMAILLVKNTQIGQMGLVYTEEYWRELAAFQSVDYAN